MTLEGVIYKADGTPFNGTFLLSLVHAPVDGEDGSTVGLSIVVACDGEAPDPVGQYSTILRAGYYAVDVAGTPRFYIFAPTGDDTFALEQLIDTTIRSAPGTVTEPIKVLGRSTDQTGPLEFIGGVSLLDLIGEETRWSLLSDEDDQTILDVDGVGIGDENQAIESPIRQTRFFLDVAEMLASTSGSWDRAVTLNWTGTGGDRQEWVMMQDPALTANGGDLLEMDDGFGFARTFTTRGATAGDNFATINSVTSAIAGTRYTHTQSVPANSWNIVHGMGLFPSVTTTNSSGKEIKGEVVWLSDTTIAVSFSRPLTGFAYLN